MSGFKKISFYECIYLHFVSFLFTERSEIGRHFKSLKKCFASSQSFDKKAVIGANDMIGHVQTVWEI